MPSSMFSPGLNPPVRDSLASTVPPSASCAGAGKVCRRLSGGGELGSRHAQFSNVLLPSPVCLFLFCLSACSCVCLSRRGLPGVRVSLSHVRVKLGIMGRAKCCPWFWKTLPSKVSGVSEAVRGSSGCRPWHEAAGSSTATWKNLPSRLHTRRVGM